MEEIIDEKIRADHLLYVSLKYTKTCDVIVNLLLRWRRMIETSTEKILRHAKKKKRISSLPTSPVGRIEAVRNLFRRNRGFLDVIDFYGMLRKMETLRQERTGEFRKNVTLKIFYQGKEVAVNLEQLKVYAGMLEDFINTTKKFLLK